MSHKADIDTNWQLDQLGVRPLKKAPIKCYKIQQTVSSFSRRLKQSSLFFCRGTTNTGLNMFSMDI